MLTRFLHATSRVDFYRRAIAEKLEILLKSTSLKYVYIDNKQAAVSKTAIRLCLYTEQLPSKGKNNLTDEFPLGVRMKITSARAF